MAIMLIVAGLGLAAFVQTRGGVTVSRVHFRAPDGVALSALLYRPSSATVTAPAPGILAVHGYFNTAETQAPFAIEFARRGYVVLALDQRGHGGSGGAATRDGFGGPEALAYLRALPFVDRARIGLEGHSMGGWAVLAAAAAMPDAYRAIVLEGSSVGSPFAREGTRSWPRNIEVVFSRYDEFAPIMWGVERAADVGNSAKLQALFGTTAAIVPGQLYGSIAEGTARRLETPVTTHPGNHLSPAAVAAAIDWFDLTISPAAPAALAPDDQIWMWKEAGTGLALIGLALLTFALFELLLAIPFFAPLRSPAGAAAPSLARRRWWLAFLFAFFVPAATFYLAIVTAPPPIPLSILFPQAFTNWLLAWALANALLGILFFKLSGGSISSPSLQVFGRAALLSLAVVALLFGIVALAALIPLDFRFWIVALRPLEPRLIPAFLVCLAPFTIFLLVAFSSVDALIAGAPTKWGQAGIAVAAVAGGFLALAGLQYAYLFATGALPWPIEGLNVILALQFLPLLAGLALLAVFSRERTGGILTGALIGGLFVSWYVVAGTATHVSIS